MTALPAAPPRRGLPSGAALLLQASIIVSFLAASSAPTPLYAFYQHEWGFPPITTTIVFGVYAVCVLIALLVVGSLSDHVGRKPVILVALVAEIAVLILFAYANGVPVLVLSRAVQGLATGAAISASGAGMLDVDRTRGTLANAVSPASGTAVGAVVSGLFVEYLPDRSELIYFVCAGVMVLQAVGVVLLRETASRTPGALASLKIELAVAPNLRGPLARVAPALFAVWALAGFYGSLGPALVRSVVGSSAPVLGGLALFALAGCAALAVLVLRDLPARRVIQISTVTLTVGVALALGGVAAKSAPLFFIGTVIAGTGFGGGFQGGVRSVVPLAQPHERSGVLSVLYVVSYLGLGVPSVIAGFLVSHGDPVTTAATEYGIAVIVLALIVLALSLRNSDAPHHRLTGQPDHHGVGTVAVDVCADCARPRAVLVSAGTGAVAAASGADGSAGGTAMQA